jgi:magnesium transporter
MAKKRHKRKSKLGLPPGSIIFTGERKMEEILVSVICYSETGYEEFSPTTLEELFKLIANCKGTVWINIDGLHEEDSIEKICGHFGIHKLTTEDILSIGQRPKLEEHTDYMHAVLKMFMIADEDDTIEDEQLSFVLKNNTLITFQEKTGDVFDSVRKRIKEGKGYIRKRGASYLLYALMDSVVDYYFLILESIGEKLEEIENQLLQNPDTNTLNKLHGVRRETLYLRRSVYPLREVVGRFEKLDEPFVSIDTRVFIRDLYDHTIQVIETIEVFRDMASGLLDLYMNSVSNKMNEIMKVLTIMASIFIPLTFVAGVYGMNFENMPELEWKYAYFVVLGLMFLAAVFMLIYFKRKKWM